MNAPKSLSVTMGQAPGEVKDAANEQTAHVEDGGLTAARLTLLDQTETVASKE